MNSIYPTAAALRGAFFRYVPLNVLGMLALSCYIIADTFFVANGVGADGLTALNLVLPLYSLISGLGLLFGMGGATKYAIFKGTQNITEANRVFTRTVLYVLGTGFLIMVVGILFTRELCMVLGADGKILPFAEPYLRTILLFAPAFILNNAMVCFVRNDGNPKLSMLSMVVGSMSNVLLDYVFIFPLGMGMFGAAFATCMAPIIGLLVLSFHHKSKDRALAFKRCKPDLRTLWQVTAIGFSAFVTEFSSGMVMLVFNFVILGLAGNLGVAAYSIVANIALFAIAVFAGISEGVQPLISHAYGAGDFSSLRKVYLWAVGLAAGIGLLFYLLIVGFSGQIAGAFNREGDTALLQAAVEGMRLYFPMLFLSGINIVTASLFASMSMALESFLISASRGLFCVVAFVFVLSARWGMQGVWCTMPLTEAVTFLFCIIFLHLLLKNKKNCAKGN